ncbi:hypothetical protein TcYC6_0107740 [Trypanosoma cruzi]|nr:hypothetical protein TcYC6_0107740 [Trypanosoma cruzi]
MVICRCSSPLLKRAVGCDVNCCHPDDRLTLVFGKHRQTPGGFEPYRTCCESPGAPSTKFRDTSAPAHRVGAARELGQQKGLLISERERLIADYAHAIADVQNRSVQFHSQVEEAHNKLSVRESDIAVAGGLLAERERALAGSEQQLEATRTQLQDREARISAREAQQAAWEAETVGREEVSASRRGPADGPVACHNKAKYGVTKKPH